MKVTLLQQDIVWADPSANVAAAEKAIANAPKSDLYILPEMWSTGFATEPEGIAESDNSDSLKWMIDAAARYDAAIGGSIAVKSSVDGSYRNRFYFVKPDGEVTFYDKHHLFTYGGEHLRFGAGDKRVVVEWRGVSFMLLVCYELRFPIWSRNNEDYDAILYIASWPTPRVDAWRTLLRARAIENQCYVCGVNRVGNDPSCQYCGGTAFIDPYGKADQCPDGEVSSVTGEIDMDALEAFRKKFPVLKDRDIVTI